MQNWMHEGANGTDEHGETIWRRVSESPEEAGWQHSELVGLELHFGYQVIRFEADGNTTATRCEQMPDEAMDGPLGFLRGEGDIDGDIRNWLHTHRDSISYSLGNAVREWLVAQ